MAIITLILFFILWLLLFKGSDNAPLITKNEECTIITNVAGVTFKNTDGSSRQEIIRKLSIGESLEIKHDMNNIYDNHAIKVLSRFGCIGFIPKPLNSDLFLNLSRIKKISLKSKKKTAQGFWGCIITITLDHYSPQNKNELKIDTHQQQKIYNINTLGNKTFFLPSLLSEIGNAIIDIFQPNDELYLEHKSFGKGRVLKVESRIKQNLPPIYHIDFMGLQKKFNANSINENFFSAADVASQSIQKYMACLELNRNYLSISTLTKPASTSKKTSLSLHNLAYTTKKVEKCKSDIDDAYSYNAYLDEQKEIEDNLERETCKDEDTLSDYWNYYHRDD